MTAPNTIIVDTLNDVVDAMDGVTSLREAIDIANTTSGEFCIEFSVAGTITLDVSLRRAPPCLEGV